MEENVKKSLEEKAVEVSKFLNSVDISHTYRLIEYGINFTLRHVGNEHTLTLSYSPKKKRWTPYSVSEWVEDAVVPLVQPLLGETRTSGKMQEFIITGNVRDVSPRGIYFAEARKCLNILEPFAEENVDFSIICGFARRGVQLVLSNPEYALLDRSSLLALLEQPPQSEFYVAKEYLFRCLTVCGVTEN